MMMNPTSKHLEQLASHFAAFGAEGRLERRFHGRHIGIADGQSRGVDRPDDLSSGLGEPIVAARDDGQEDIPDFSG